MALTERDEIVLWLGECNPDAELIARLPMWRVMIWALLHPIRFAIAGKLASVSLSIHAGEHREGK